MATKTQEEAIEKALRKTVDAARDYFSESEVRRMVESELNSWRKNEVFTPGRSS